jgi:hypothetical protein
MKLRYAMAAAASILTLSMAGGAVAQTVSTYDGVYGSSAYYDPFFSSEGFVTNDIGADFSASDIVGSQLVILSAVSSYTSEQLSALDSYVDSGGRLVLASDGQYFEAYQAAENAVLTSLGSSIVNVDGAYDPETSSYPVTTDIASSPFTAGVGSIEYAYTSAETGGDILVTGLSGQGIVSEQAIGSGYVFAISDINLQEGLSDPSVGNGQLFLNFANASAISAAPEPSSWFLMLAGIGVLGLMLRHARARNGGRLGVAAFLRGSPIA